MPPTGFEPATFGLGSAGRATMFLPYAAALIQVELRGHND